MHRTACLSIDFGRNGFSNIKLNPILPNIQVGKRNQPNSIVETLPNMAAPGCRIRPLVRTVFFESCPFSGEFMAQAYEAKRPEFAA